MMSLLAMSGLMASDLGGLSKGGNSDWNANRSRRVAELSPQPVRQSRAAPAAFAPSRREVASLDYSMGNEGDSIYEIDRGEVIYGFDPANDIIELEYSQAMGKPEVTITRFADGRGASIALNGVVVADVAGAQGLNPSHIVLTPV